MRFATRDNGSLDGELLLVSTDGARAIAAGDAAPSLLFLLQNWGARLPALEALSARLEAGEVGHFAFDPSICRAPLPRAPQWIDASAFLNHQRLMAQAFKTPAIPNYETVPVMYQGASDDFLGGREDCRFPDEADGIDFEGEFAVVLDETPMGVSAEAALDVIRLVVQLNDWSLRVVGSQEVRSGFGFLQAKPSTSFAPVAATPDALGHGWRDGRVHLELHVDWNGRRVGRANGGEMHFHFGALIAYAARTRTLKAGTVIGSGTVSNADRTRGSSCVAELRMIETLDLGEVRTGFLRFGDRIRMEALAPGSVPGSGPFGIIDQQVISAA